MMKVPVGPIVEPKPGPTLEIAVAAPDIAVRKSSPINPRPVAKTAKERAYRKKNPITELPTVSSIGFLL